MTTATRKKTSPVVLMGFTAPRVAKFVDVPIRTVQGWKSTGFYKPQVSLHAADPMEAAYLKQREFFGVSDVLAVACIKDLKSLQFTNGNPIPRSIIKQVAQDVGTGFWDLGTLIKDKWCLVIYPDTDSLEEYQERAKPGESFVKAYKEANPPDILLGEHAGYYLTRPLYDLAADLKKKIEAWMEIKGLRDHHVAPWVHPEPAKAQARAAARKREIQEEGQRSIDEWEAKKEEIMRKGVQ